MSTRSRTRLALVCPHRIDGLRLDAWVFTDHFADVIVRADGVTHFVMDLDDLANGRELGLITEPDMAATLCQTQDGRHDP